MNDATFQMKQYKDNLKTMFLHLAEKEKAETLLKARSKEIIE